jgi:hypothetical protein
MAKKINEFSILQPLAKELGYKNADELKEALGKEEVGRGTRGAMGNIGGAGVQELVFLEVVKLVLVLVLELKNA